MKIGCFSSELIFLRREVGYVLASSKKERAANKLSIEATE